MKVNRTVEMNRQLLLMQLIVETVLLSGSDGMSYDKASRVAYDLVERLMQRYAGVSLHRLHHLRDEIRNDVYTLLTTPGDDACEGASLTDHEDDYVDYAALPEPRFQVSLRLPDPRLALGRASQLAGNLGRGVVRNTRAVLSAGASGVAHSMARTASRLSPKG